MHARISSNFDQIGLLTAELAPLGRLKKIPIDLPWKKCCNHSSTFIFEWIFFILAGNKDSTYLESLSQTSDSRGREGAEDSC